jgi:ADP-ribose pyrophosphatase
MTNIYRERRPIGTMRNVTYFLAIILFVIPSFILLSKSTSSLLKFATTSECLVSFGEYHGHRYQSAGFVEGKCLVESKWMQVMQHKIQLDEKTLIDDWLFIDYHDRINVLVEDPKSLKGDTKFLIFRQTKYALEGRQSLAIVGGIIEPGEESTAAAAREVNEELGLDCQFHFLGRFRTDVNRGMGWVNSFIAHDCEKTGIKENKEMIVSDEVGAPDTEQQDVTSMSISDVRQNVRKGQFLEVQWSNTVALAMLDARYD